MIPGATVTARGVSLNPTRTGAIAALEAMGARVTYESTGAEAGEPIGNVTVTGTDRLEAFDLTRPDTPRLPTLLDEVPALAMVAARARGVSRLRGAAELRVKESDRLSSLAINLRRVGVEVDELPDGLAIVGGAVRGGEVDAKGDHRIAMAFAVLGVAAESPITIRGAREIVTSYPGFVAALRELGAQVEASEEDALQR
jgi:3-phosphoshikimate 1-carboxyvinyltransferase